MGISSKLLLVLGAVLAILLAVCVYSVETGRRAIETSIAAQARGHADALSFSVTNLLYSSIDPWFDFARSPGVLAALEASNRHFEQLPQREQFIRDNDALWMAASRRGAEGVTDEAILALTDQALNQKLKAELHYLDQKLARSRPRNVRFGADLFSEVFITNRYGVNLAQTNLTSDYFQADEIWWQRAKERGLYVGDFSFDLSADVDAIEVSLAVEDDLGVFAGVIKVIINAGQFLTALDSLAAELISSDPVHLALLTRTKRVIYSASDGARKLPEFSLELRARAMEADSLRHALTTHDRSGGKKLYSVLVPLQQLKKAQNLDWVLLIEYDAEQYFAPIDDFRRNLYFVFAAALLITAVGGALFAGSLTRRITSLKVAADELGRGVLERRVRVEGADEIAALGTSFNEMAEQLEEARNDLLIARERAEAATRAKSLFLAKMSHEIRTPLNALTGMIEFALDGPLQDSQREELQIAHQAAGSLTRLLKDILDSSRIESGRLDLEERPFALRPNLAAEVNLFRKQAAGKNVRLEYEISEEAEDYFIGDWGRIAQILSNLLSNAIKFTPSGGRIRLAVTGAPLDAPPASDRMRQILSFAVEDTGSGIPEEHCREIFDAFVQAGQPPENIEGSGLGLFIAARLVELLGGELKVRSSPGKGSIFEFTCALIIDHDAEQRGEADEREYLLQFENRPLRGAKVLVVEDNVVNQVLACKLLDKLGCECVVASNGRQAVAEFSRGGIDLVLMDLEMPEMDGVEATRAMRRFEAEWQLAAAANSSPEFRENRPSRIPIIALTAYAMDADRERCFAVGMDDFLTKPIDRRDFYRCISGHLAAKHQECLS